MPAAIISGTVTFIQDTLELKIWDGEIPRRDEDGVVINLDNAPVFKVTMPEAGFNVEPTFEDLMPEEGELTIYVLATTREVVENNIISINGLLIKESNWSEINVGTNANVFEFVLRRWTCFQLELVRTQTSEYVYQGELHYSVRINVGVLTR